MIIPAAVPPHKHAESVSGPYHRYAMAVMATLEFPGAAVSTIEIERPDRPYTYETIEALRSFYGEQASLFFIVGSDSFEEIHHWREPMRVLSKASLIVAARTGHEMVNPRLLDIAARKGASGRSAGGRGGAGTKQTPLRIVDLRSSRGSAMLECDDATNRIFLTDYVRRDISSTEIRRRVREEESIRDLVPPAVATYIEKYRLYRTI